jgi:cobalt-zinc-cadmium efflux system protein
MALTTRVTPGTGRKSEVLAAQVSAVLLLAAGGWILLEGVVRLRDPAPVDGAGLAAVATVGLIVNLGSAVLVHGAEGESMNMRASFVHLATDAAGSLGAIIAGLVILGTGWMRADSLVSLATGLLVIWAGWTILRDTTHVLMEGTPRGMDAETVRSAMLELDEITDVHHLHLWNLASDVPALSAHVVITGDPSLRDSQQSADRLRTALADRFALTHITLEIECGPTATARASLTGGDLGQQPSPFMRRQEAPSTGSGDEAVIMPSHR